MQYSRNYCDGRIALQLRNSKGRLLFGFKLINVVFQQGSKKSGKVRGGVSAYIGGFDRFLSLAMSTVLLLDESLGSELASLAVSYAAAVGPRYGAGRFGSEFHSTMNPKV